MKPKGKLSDAQRGVAPPIPNKLLGALAGSERRRLSPYLEDVNLRARQVLCESRESFDHIYFPCGAVISLLAVMSDGTSIQAAMVGNEGMVGISVLRVPVLAPGRALCQIAGAAQRIKTRDFRRLVDVLPDLRRVLDHHMRALIIQFSQNVACNCLHSIEQRCARWLLMTADRTGADAFALTQQFLASMLGVRRASVSEAAARLQRQGLLRYHWGHVTILDRPGLTAAACECYGVIRKASDWLAA